MGVFKKIMDLLRGETVSALNKIEDPIKKLDLLINDMEDSIYVAKKDLAPIIGETRQLEGMQTSSTQKLKDLESEIKQYIKQNKQQEAQRRVISYNQLKEEITQYAEVIEMNNKIIQDAKDKIAVMEKKRGQLNVYKISCKSRHLSSEVTINLNKIFMKAGAGELFDLQIPEIENKLKEDEAIAIGIEEINNTNIAAIGTAQSEVDLLENFKREHGL